MTNFAKSRALFDLPDGVIYLDGNSLGPLPKAVSKRVAEVVEAEWGKMLIGGWNKAGWMEMPRRLGDRLGRLIGAPAGTVVVGDTLSIKVYQALAAALALRSDRKIILSDTGNFPSDLYVAEGLLRMLGRDDDLRVVSPEALEDAMDETLAVLMLTEVDYRTGRRHDLPRLVARAHAVGALVIVDLAHSAGALPVDVSALGADFALGCTYKYLNGGPGAPAFIYVAPDFAEIAEPALAGWLGHRTPFAFDLEYQPGRGIDRMRVGTPPILQMAALEAALDVWDGIDMNALRARSIELSELFIREVEARCPSVALASPRVPEQRGSQVSFRFDEGYAVMQALIARGVIGDFRAPDIMRFGITPLYLDESDILRASEVIENVLETRDWDRPEFRKREAVT